MSKQLQLLVFVLDERQYGLHLSQVNRVVSAVDVTPLPSASDLILGAIDLRGTIVPLFNIRRRFGIIEREIGVDDQFIIARNSKRTVALCVDSVVEIAERPAEQLVEVETILNPLGLITGIVRLEGGLVLIHDLDRFLSFDEQRDLEEALTKQSNHGNHGT